MAGIWGQPHHSVQKRGPMRTLATNTMAPALHWALAGGQPETIELLLAPGAEARARNAEGRTAHDPAQARDRDEIAVLLRQAGATAPGRGD